MNVRFTPKSGHWNSVVECLLCAKSRHCEVRSMTSSALAIKPGERRSPGIGSRLDNSKKVQPALDADTQVALAYSKPCPLYPQKRTSDQPIAAKLHLHGPAFSDSDVEAAIASAMVGLIHHE